MWGDALVYVAQIFRTAMKNIEAGVLVNGERININRYADIRYTIKRSMGPFTRDSIPH